MLFDELLPSQNHYFFFLKHFHGGGFNFHLMNVQSTTGEMFYTTFFLFPLQNICQLWSKKSFCNIICFLHLLFFQFVADFSLFRAYFRKKLLENHHLFFLKHFHDGGFNFHLMIVQSTAVETFSSHDCLIVCGGNVFN